MTSEPRRVLVTTDTMGGVWTYSIELARALGRRGIEVVLATMGEPMSEAQRLDTTTVPLVTVHESTYRLEWMADAWDDVDRSGAWLLDLAAREHVDVVHLGSMSHGSLPWPVPTVVVGHSCIYSWWRAVRGTTPGEGFQTYRRRVAAGLRGARRVIAPTRTMADALATHYGPIPAVGVIPNGRGRDAFMPRGKRPFVFGAGRVWDPAKNLSMLDEAADTIPWPVYIAGANLAPDGSHQRLQHARWLGVLSEGQMGFWMSRASIYVLPARYEPSGLSILEAALAGCALVLGDIPSLRELWAGAAVFVDADDSAHCARVLNRLIADDHARLELAARARSRALGRTPAAMAEAYLSCYRDAAGIRAA